MIKKNSSVGPLVGHYELTPRGRYEKEHDISFKEVREVLLNSLPKNHNEEDLEKKSSFIVYSSPGGKFTDNLDWKRILDILKESKIKETNYLKFLRELENASRLELKEYFTMFTLDNLDRFLSDVLAEVIDDGGIPDVPLITEKQRNKIFEYKEEEEDGEEEKEFNESSEKSGEKMFKIIQLQRETIALLEQIGEKWRLLKENPDQKNFQISEELEKEINQLKKEYSQKKYKLEELEKQLNYIMKREIIIK